MSQILATTKVLILNEKNELLLLKIGVHTKQPQRSHTIDLPGGFVDGGESEKIGAVREVMEETGIKLDPANIHLAYGMTDVNLEHNVSVTHLLYITRLDYTPEVKISWEHESFYWANFDTVLQDNDIRSRYTKFIEHVQQHDLFSNL
jgi:8-oxo-dGTP pyrophosphatase MutT (NUDIX family)